ncbi:hypothetical protein CcCBS67573_g08737 [Chytriomyces confervae]|uniref:non-specific serine/threonine protein kinase n=1 Tax=Chytriomyces confervae TaxID=246404 RepID=A0A507EG42_9FUNG|nr:hypothetical protein CcCBS67573_g08737 [Chytriomyces confervae]
MTDTASLALSLSNLSVNADETIHAAETKDWDSSPAIGRLHFKIIEARNLFLPTTQDSKPSKRPYCVVDFDKSQFVSREAIATNVLGPEEAAIANQADGQNHVGQDRSSEDGTWMCPIWKHEGSFDVSGPNTELAISIWDRCEGSGEIFLGQLIVVPPLHHGKIYDHWFRLSARQTNEKISGDIRLQLMFKSLEQSKSLCAEDFTTLKLVGKGSFGKVVLVKKKDTGRVYAMKILSKKHIVERQEITHTIAERNVLIRAARSPFLVGMKFSFQTPEKLYLVTDYMNGGELFYHLQREGVFSEQQAKFYTCELTCALEFLHKHSIVYRDLKPENVLFDSNGHITLTDFGLCKENFGHSDKTNTFCGTAAYLAPEILLGEGYGQSVDWWALGILFYEMVTGLPPFYSENVNLMYKKILHNQLLFPIGTLKEAESFIRALLDRNPLTRLGSGPTGALEIKQHPYLSNVDWARLEKKAITPPFKPLVESETDTSNFDPFFTEDPNGVAPSLPNNGSVPLSDTMQENFKGFTFEANGLSGSVQSSVGRF